MVKGIAEPSNIPAHAREGGYAINVSKIDDHQLLRLFVSARTSLFVAFLFKALQARSL